MSRVVANLAPLAALVLSACTFTAATQTAALQVVATPQDAVVYVDETPVGRADGTPHAIDVGAESIHVLLVREGYLPRRFEVRVTPGRLHVISVELWPELPELDDEGTSPP